MCFKYIYPTDTKDKTKVACLLCQKAFDNIERNFMAAHQSECKGKMHSSSVERSQATGLPSAVNTIGSSSQGAANDKRPACNYTLSTTSPIDLNELQFDKFKLLLTGNTTNCVKCRLCKDVFLMDQMKWLQHRYASQKTEAIAFEYRINDVFVTILQHSM